MKNWLSTILFAVLVLVLLLPQIQSSAQENLERVCSSQNLEAKSKQLSEQEYKDLLKKCQGYVEERLEEVNQEIAQTEEEINTKQNKIYNLRQRIENLSYQIRQSNLVIEDLTFQIQDTKDSIEKTSVRIQESTRKLSGILRAIYEQNEKTTVEVLLAEDKLSSFFNNLVSLEVLSSKNRELLKDIKDLKEYLKKQKQDLANEKDELEKMVELKNVQKQQSADLKQEQQYYLGLTKEEYQQQQQQQNRIEERAAEIRERLFELAAIPEAPSFGEALELANSIEDMTGVRPAFLLAILTQESNIFERMNVGNCYLKDPETGAGVMVSSGEKIQNVMKPSRDVQPFLKTTRNLGRDPYTTPVSCPMSYGYGGAMGPAQFIPSTWEIYEPKVEKNIGRSADPWKIKDSFLAAAFLLADNKANKQTYNTELNAAVSYFAGSNWRQSSYSEVYKRDYGYPVMQITKEYSEDIETLEKAQ